MSTHPSRTLPAGATRPALGLLQYRRQVSPADWLELCDQWEGAYRDAKMASGGNITEAEAVEAANHHVRRVAAGMIARSLGRESVRQSLGVFSPELTEILSDGRNLW